MGEVPKESPLPARPMRLNLDTLPLKLVPDRSSARVLVSPDRREMMPTQAGNHHCSERPGGI